MSNFCDVIRKTIQSQPLTFDGAPYESAMDALYTLYSAHHPIDDALMREGSRNWSGSFPGCLLTSGTGFSDWSVMSVPPMSGKPFSRASGLAFFWQRN